LYFARINSYAFAVNSVVQKYYTIQPEFALGKLSIKLIVSETLENNAQVLRMLLII
jgi:hypothetical protein